MNQCRAGTNAAFSYLLLKMHSSTHLCPTTWAIGGGPQRVNQTNWNELDKKAPGDCKQAKGPSISSYRFLHAMAWYGMAMIHPSCLSKTWEGNEH
jgi:hypothetical protein